MAEKFLVIQTAFIGDVILATALIESLREAYPGARIDMLVRKGNESLVQDHPHLYRILVWDKQRRKYRHLLGLLWKIRRERYDRVINVQRYAATGLLTAFSRSRESIGFDRNPLSWLFRRRVLHRLADRPAEHETERNHRLIAHLPGVRPARPRLYPSEEDRRQIAPLTLRPYMTISPASVWLTKQFPPEKWAALINRMPADMPVYLLGGPDDRSLGEAITMLTGRSAPVNLCGELSLLQSAALMEKAVLNYVNDSAPMHLASALNAPVVAVYCSTVPEFGYTPLSDLRHIVQIAYALYCRPCGKHGKSACPEGHFRCAHDIRDEQLLLW